MRLAHLSDLHFGKIALPHIVEDLLTTLRALELDLVVVSGDLTQRARRREYRAAASFLEALPAPHVVVPGNHDVYPWWRPVSRLARPLRQYRRYIREDVDDAHRGPGLAVLALNSAHGRTIKGGRMPAGTRRRIQHFFADRPGTDFRVLAVHHQLLRLEALWPHDLTRHRHRVLDVCGEAGVDIILCGHMHIAHHEAVTLPDGHQVVIAASGTTTSSRGRRRDRRRNSFNLLTVDASSFSVTTYRYDAQARTFGPAEQRRYPRAE